MRKSALVPLAFSHTTARPPAFSWGLLSQSPVVFTSPLRYGLLQSQCQFAALAALDRSRAPQSVAAMEADSRPSPFLTRRPFRFWPVTCLSSQSVRLSVWIVHNRQSPDRRERFGEVRGMRPSMRMAATAAFLHGRLSRAGGDSRLHLWREFLGEFLIQFGDWLTHWLVSSRRAEPDDAKQWPARLRCNGC